MCGDSDLVADFDAIRFPALSSDLRYGTHLERPLGVLSGSGIDGSNVKPAMRIGPFKRFQRPRYGDYLFFVEHRKRMVRCGLTRKHSDNSDNDCQSQLHQHPPLENSIASVL